MSRERLADQAARLKFEQRICAPLHANNQLLAAVRERAMEKPYFNWPYGRQETRREAGNGVVEHSDPRGKARIDSNRPDNGQSAFPDRETDS